MKRLLASALLFACNQSQSAQGPGKECFLATDCAPGLVCVEQPNKTRLCSDDISRVVGRPPAEAGAPDAGRSQDAAPDEQDAAPPDPEPPDAAPPTGDQ